MEKKLEVIRKVIHDAYVPKHFTEEEFKEAECAINFETGWFNSHTFKIQTGGTARWYKEFLPCELKGLHNNNGWFSIEEHGLPKKSGDYRWISKSGNFTTCDFEPNELGNEIILKQFTHYKTIENELLPHY